VRIDRIKETFLPVKIRNKQPDAAIFSFTGLEFVVLFISVTIQYNWKSKAFFAKS
jgi:hypothetical protein